MVIPWEGLFVRGIYLWTNIINGKKYVGKSENIQKRKRSYKDEIKRDSSRYIIKAMKKHGLENFKFEILEKIENDINILEKEQFWMDHYDTMDKNKGYNVLKAEETPGESFSKGSKNNKAKLTEEDVLEIRKKIYIEKIEKKHIFLKFKEKISYDTFLKVCRGETWKEVDTKMIKNLNKEVKRKNEPKAKLNKDVVLKIRERFQDGETISDIFLDYCEICTRNTIKRVIEKKTWNK